MTSPAIDRRQMFAASALIAAGLAGTAKAEPRVSPAAAGPTITPLPFDPATTPGLSARLLNSHHDNNYAGAVRRLAAIRTEFGGLDVATAPGYRLNGLKREELLAWNSVILHEVYFAGFGSTVTASPALSSAIERDFGSQQRWAAEFSAMGRALGGGSGWVLLAWSPHDGRLVNQWASDHSQTLAGSVPLVALDMYEHAYHLDYGAQAGAYVDTFMRVLSWRHANDMFGRLAAPA